MEQTLGIKCITFLFLYQVHIFGCRVTDKMSDQSEHCDSPEKGDSDEEHLVIEEFSSTEEEGSEEGSSEDEDGESGEEGESGDESEEEGEVDGEEEDGSGKTLCIPHMKAVAELGEAFAVSTV